MSKPSTSASDSFGIVVGVGSVGFRHLEFVVSRYGFSYVVDPNDKVRRKAKATFGSQVKCFMTLDDLYTQDFAGWKGIAVVSNWGPDHYKTWKSLQTRGVEHIFVEKPIGVSAWECQQYVAAVRSRECRLLAGFQRRYSDLGQRVNQESEWLGHSPPSSMVVFGGALDISTNGVHWLDVACQVFRGQPVQVVAVGNSQNINPRHQSLDYWEGSVIWSFSEDRRLTVSFDNRSSLGSRVFVLSRNACLEVGANGLTIGQRDLEAIRRNPELTRHGQPLTFSNVSSEELGLTNWREVAFDKLESDCELDSLASSAASVTEGLLAALWAMKTGKRVALPLQKEHPAYKKRWPVS